MSNDNHTVSPFRPSTGVHPRAQPFFLAGGKTGILLIHGYGGSIGDYRSIGEALNRNGFTVGGLALPGHGQTREALVQTDYSDWREMVFAGAAYMRQTCNRLFVLGASFGGLLAIDYGLHAPKAVTGVITVNTGLSYKGGGKFQRLLLKIIKLFTPYFPKRRTPAEAARAKEVGSLDVWPIEGILSHARFIQIFIRPHLAELKPRYLSMVSTDDPVTNPVGAKELFEAAGSKQKELWEYQSGTHNPARSAELQQQILAKIQEFVQPELD